MAEKRQPSSRLKLPTGSKVLHPKLKTTKKSDTRSASAEREAPDVEEDEEMSQEEESELARLTNIVTTSGNMEGFRDLANEHVKVPIKIDIGKRWRCGGPNIYVLACARWQVQHHPPKASLCHRDGKQKWTENQVQ